MSNYPNGYVDEPISEDTYLAMLKLKWCKKAVNGLVHLTPKGERELLAACSRLGVKPETRPEWLAPD